VGGPGAWTVKLRILGCGGGSSQEAPYGVWTCFTEIWRADDYTWVEARTTGPLFRIEAVSDILRKFR
jgi:hypothetical protein